MLEFCILGSHPYMKLVNGNNGHFSSGRPTPSSSQLGGEFHTSRKRCFSLASFSFPIGTGAFIDLDECLQEKELNSLSSSCYNAIQEGKILLD